MPDTAVSKQRRLLSISFTGTSHRDLTNRQCAALADYLREHSTRLRAIHLGDCIKADEQMHTLVCEAGLWQLIVLPPPKDPKKRAFCNALHNRRPKPYLERNRDLAAACHILLAAPAQAHEVQRSGTWATVRYARQLGIPVRIFFP